MEQTLLYVALGAGVLALLYGIITRGQILALPTGTEKMQEIASAIKEGASAYMTRQYTAISIRSNQPTRTS